MKKGFTLIELLAVIVILAIIALITTPMILGIIETARKGAAESSKAGYLDAVEKQIMINQLDSNATPITDGVYDLPMDGITVKGNEPTEGWIKIENGKIADYSMKIMDYTITKDTPPAKEEVEEKPVVETNYVCKRATTLHTEECTEADSGCYSDGYTGDNTTIEYGNKTTTPNQLNSGDAFDCDVNGDGTYDPQTERFYYVTDLESNSNYAVLVYYNNTNQGVPDNSISGYIEYNLNYDYNNGPLKGIENLPTTEQWSNVSLSSTTRAITNELGTTTKGEITLPQVFSYTKTVDGRTIPLAARFLTFQEIYGVCGEEIPGYEYFEYREMVNLVGCNYFMENTTYGNYSLQNHGYWLETPYSEPGFPVWTVFGLNSTMDNTNSYNYDDEIRGVRPAIEVLKTKISY